MKPRMRPDSVVQSDRLNFRQAKLAGLWETFAAELRDCGGQERLVEWYNSDATQALLAQMPEAWLEEAEAAYHDAWSDLGGVIR